MGWRGNQWGVAIVRKSDNEVHTFIPAGSFREAERIERGVSINLNRKDYRTQVIFNQFAPDPKEVANG